LTSRRSIETFKNPRITDNAYLSAFGGVKT